MLFGDTRVSLADVDPHDVTGMLRAIGSTDPDVLFAAKTEYGRTFKIQKTIGLAAMILGVCSALMIVLAIVGVPLMVFGFWYWRKGNRNLAALEATYSTFAATVTPMAADRRPVSGVPYPA